MARKRVDGGQFGTAVPNNEDLIRAALIQYQLTQADDNDLIMSLLVRHRHNVDAIENDAERQAACQRGRFEEPSAAERIEFCRTAGLSGADGSKRSIEWLSCLVNGKLTNRVKYHRLRKTRLMEQLRKVRGQVEKAWLHAEREQAYAVAAGDAGATDWADSDSAPLSRFSTGLGNLDAILGVTKTGSGKKLVEQWGAVRGKQYAIAAAQGTGKTRLMVALIRKLCGPVESGPNGDFGGLSAVYFQSEMGKGDFRSTFLDGVWTPGVHNVKLSGDTLLREHEKILRDSRPDLVVIDSKDMIHEFKTGSMLVQSLQQYKRWAEEIGFACFIISHANKKGEVKGRTEFGHTVDAVMIAEREEHDKDVFSLMITKHRMGRVFVPAYFKHTEKSIVEWTPGKMQTKMDTQLAMLIKEVDPRGNERAIRGPGLLAVGNEPIEAEDEEGEE